jgi:NhaA family Na+:H+ antiporter
VIIFLLVNLAIRENYKAFAVPCATDIAFALGAFNAILGDSKTLKSAKMFLLALATFDDIGAIVLIAAFYNNNILAIPLIFTLVGVLILLYSRYFDSQNFFIYISSGILIWVGLYTSGIHTTITGVIIGMLLPKSAYGTWPQFLESALNKIVPLLILPIFAFSACNIELTNLKFQDLTHPITLGVFLGLFIGKQIGIYFFTLLAVKIFAIKVENLSWWDVYCVSVLGGIGFTMSLFIGELSFTNKESLNLIKTGLVLGSVSSILWSLILAKAKNLYLGNKC